MDKSWALLRMVRIPILVGGFLGCYVGALLGLAGGGFFDPLRFLVCYLAIGLGDLSTHFSNNYYDVELDRFEAPKKFGIVNPLTARPDLTLLTLRSARLLSFVSITLSLAAVALGASPLLVFLALTINILGWLYSMPPIRLVSRGLGEAAIAFATGFVVPAAGYISTQGSLDIRFLLYSVPLIFYGFVLSLSLELPDVEADKVGGKLNLVVRLGWRASLLVSLVICSVSTLMLWVVFGLYAALGSLVPLSSLLIANLLGSEDRRRLDNISTGCIVSLFGFLLLVLGYLVFSSL